MTGTSDKMKKKKDPPKAIQSYISREKETDSYCNGTLAVSSHF